MTETIKSQRYAIGDEISLRDKNGNTIDGRFSFIDQVDKDLMIGVDTHTVYSSSLEGDFEIEGDRLKVIYRE